MGLFFLSHTPVLCSLSGAGGCEDELAARSGSGLLVFSAAAGTGWSSCPRAGAKGVQLRDRALTTPLGVVVPGSRSIECIWECECGYRVHFCVSTCGARVVYIHLRA